MRDVTFQPKIIALLCNWCSYRAADLAGTSRTRYSPCVRAIRVMCSGRVDPTYVLKAFSLGADAVVIAGCHPGDCHYLEQNFKTIRRHSMLCHTLRALGIDERRVRLVWASAAEGQNLAAAFDQITEDVRELGPLRWSGQWQRGADELDAVERVPEEHARTMEVVP